LEKIITLEGTKDEISNKKGERRKKIKGEELKSRYLPCI
jgi:hypothetical protein